MNQSNFFIKAIPLLLVLFIDGMGLGLIFPLLNGLIFDPNTHFLNGRVFTPAMQNITYGIVIGIFMLCWFFGAAMMGDLSDYIGRKKSLIVCCLGAGLGYLLSAFAVLFHSLGLLLLGRVIAGLTSGSQSIAQAAIIDLSEPENKARNLGFVLCSLSMGFIVGPLLGGLLSNSSLVSWFSFTTPFYFASSIAFLSAVLLWVLFDETFVVAPGKVSISLMRAIALLTSAFKHETVKILSCLFFIFIFGWSSFYSFIAMYLWKVYDYSPTQISFFMAVMAAGFGLGNGFLVNYFSKRFELRDNFIYPALIGAITIFLMLFLHNDVLDWILMLPLACCISIAYAAALTLFSNQVGADAQGWVMGITGSIMAFVFAVNGIVIGALVTINPNLPIVIAALSLFIAAIFPYFYYQPSK